MTDDRIHLDPAAVSRHLDGIAQTGRALAGGWRGHAGALAGSEPGIGGDVIGQAIRAAYLPAATAVRAAADVVPGMFTDLADTGIAIVRDYVDSDAASADGITGAGPSVLA